MLFGRRRTMHVCRSARTRPIIHHLDAHRPHTFRRLFPTAVSLHAHTWYSREPLAFIEPLAARVPVVSRLTRRHLARDWRRSGKRIDFAQAFFRPPSRPPQVLRSEVDQIVRVLDCDPLVSITDHDSIKSGQILRSAGIDPLAPISFEWTVPFGSTVLHLGVHNLPARHANGLLRILPAYSLRTSRIPLVDLFDALASHPVVLIVVNHPLWDLSGADPAGHRRQVTAFLAAHARQVHALELNGFRAHAENLEVEALSHRWSLPLVAGGDRHGLQPNAVLNLTAARSFDEFAADVRQRRQPDILLMPAYDRALRLRKLETAADILRHGMGHPAGQRHWTERIFYRDQGPIRRIRDHWPGGPPRWLSALVFGVTCAPFGAAWRLSSRRRPRRPPAPEPAVPVRATPAVAEPDP